MTDLDDVRRVGSQVSTNTEPYRHPRWYVATQKEFERYAVVIVLLQILLGTPQPVRALPLRQLVPWGSRFNHSSAFPRQHPQPLPQPLPLSSHTFLSRMPLVQVGDWTPLEYVKLFETRAEDEDQPLAVTLTLTFTFTPCHSVSP